MCAVLICTHTGGGDLLVRTACPRTKVASIRDRRISSWWSGVLMQSTVRPTRFTRPRAPSISRHQGPIVRASQGTCRHVPLTFGGVRERMTTEMPEDDKHDARETPRKPLPPAITTWPD